MTSQLIVAALLFCGVSAHAYTDCSDASGANRYEDNNYRGGPMPRPTTVVDDVRIYLNNTLASESTKLYDGSTTPGSLTVDFDSSSETPLSPTVSQFVKDYSIRVSFPPINQSQFPGGGPPPAQYLMICHEDNTPVP